MLWLRDHAALSLRNLLGLLTKNSQAAASPFWGSEKKREGQGGGGAGSWTPAPIPEKQGERDSAIWGLRGEEEGEISDQDLANSSSQRILRKYSLRK